MSAHLARFRQLCLHPVLVGQTDVYDGCNERVKLEEREWLVERVFVHCYI